MEIILVTEINILSLIILVWILYKNKTNIDQQMNNVLFSYVLYLVIGTIVTNSMEVLIHVPGSSILYAVKLGAVVLSRICACFLSYTWMLFTLCAEEGPRKWWLSKKRFMLLGIPAAAVSVIELLSIYTHWIYYLDSSLVFHNGPLHILQTIVIYSYYTMSSLYMQITLLFCKDKIRRKSLMLYQLFIIFLFTSGIIYYFSSAIPCTFPAITLALMMTYHNFQVQQISTDALTKLNNRRAFDIYISTLLNGQELKQFFLFMLDVDKFKRINDSFGHLEGDNALATTAELLRSVCSEKKAFIARYGGDEFVIILKNASIYEAERLRCEIYDAFDKYNTKPGILYPLHISIGFADSDMTPQRTISNIVKAADSQLYTEKHRRQKKPQIRRLR